jgi:type VI secretion system protein ImpC
LLDQSETGSNLKIKVLNASKKELLRDLQRAPEFDQSALFKKIYEEEFGIFGGSPFAGIVGDYEFGRGPEDIRASGEDLQRRRGGHTAHSFPPPRRICSTSKAHRSWMLPRDLGKIFDTTEIRQMEILRGLGGLARTWR